MTSLDWVSKVSSPQMSELLHWSLSEERSCSCVEPLSKAEVESSSFPEWSEAGASLRSALSPSATGAAASADVASAALASADMASAVVS